MSAVQQIVLASGGGDYILTPIATPAIGASFEGGFYAGLIWNEVTQSSTSTTIATGAKVFSVPDMTVTPLVYKGQSLEVRSRANPDNKMIGTVLGATGTALTLNITSVGGSGTLTDWSIMSKYRVLIAPKATGENSAIAYKNANTAAPSACITLTEGAKATAAMVAAGNSTVYPAAHWCNDLTIAGYTDWYLPARDELELFWRNLKPGTTNNYATTRYVSAISYLNLGSLDDASSDNGVNLNSSPQGAAYTTTVPGQTSVTAFQTGGAEALIADANYSASTEAAAAAMWQQTTLIANYARQLDGVKTSAFGSIRAVRRSII